MSTGTDVQWDLMEGVELVRKLNIISLPLGFAMALTGGVLFKGYSKKDLDIVGYPLKSVTTPYEPLVNSIAAIIGCKHVYIATKDRKSDEKCVFVMRQKDGRRVELFLPFVTIGKRTESTPPFPENGASGSPEE